jgi:hypothetical protein
VIAWLGLVAGLWMVALRHGLVVADASGGRAV